MRLSPEDKEGHASFGFKKEESRVPLLLQSRHEARMSLDRIKKIKAVTYRLEEQLKGVNQLLEQELKVLGEIL